MRNVTEPPAPSIKNFGSENAFALTMHRPNEAAIRVYISSRRIEVKHDTLAGQFFSKMFFSYPGPANINFPPGSK